MAQPTAYNRAFSFTNWQASYPTTPLPGDELDGELNNVKTTLDATLANLALIQNDDGTLKNESVGLDQISDEVTVGFTVPTAWVTATSYTSSPASTVFQSMKFYRCLVSHTSGTFATDLTAAKWVLVADFSSLPVGNAASVAFTPTGAIAATTVQDAIKELDDEKAPLSHTHLTTDISNSTGIGRSILSASTATAVRALLDVYSTTQVQPLDATLTALAGLSTSANKYIYFTSADVPALGDISAFMRGMLDDATAATARATIGLGTVAVYNTGTSGTNVPLLDGANTWSDVQTFSKALKIGKYLSTVAQNTTTSLTDTALLVSLEAGKSYFFRATLFFASSSTGGIKVALGGTVTATAFRQQVSVMNNHASAAQWMGDVTTTYGTSFAVSTTISAGVIHMEGGITVNSAGAMTVAAALNSAAGTLSIQPFSTLEIYEVS